MMNPEVKAKWLQALRSGDYLQGKQVLRQGNTFCCLGVLCDLYAKEQNKPWDTPHPDGVYPYDGAGALPPNEVMIWAGLPIGDPAASGNDPFVSADGEVENSLASLNDKGVSFAKIADIIEDQL